MEKSLLQALNDAKGKILDDDSVIATLETLKKEADDIGQKVEETDKVIAEIETVSQQYLPLSQVCARYPNLIISYVNFVYVFLRTVSQTNSRSALSLLRTTAFFFTQPDCIQNSITSSTR